MRMPTFARRFRRLRVQHAQRDAGFTLIEAVVSLAIFMTVSAAAITAIIGGTSSQSRTANRVAAANIAQADLEQARSQPTPAAASYTTHAPGDSGEFQVTRTVSVPTTAESTCPVGKLIKVSVVVSWTGAKQDVRSDTVIAC